MCLLVIAYKAHPGYELVLIANRDEYYERPTAPAEFWPDAPHVLAGRDLKAGGAWLGITKQGRLAAITNFRDPVSHKPGAPSRGRLVADFLLSRDSAEKYSKRISKHGESYNGFNLILGDGDKLLWYSNRAHKRKVLAPGLYGLSNHLLDTPWPKVVKAKEGLARLMNEESFPQEDALLSLLEDNTPAPDHELPDTGVGLEWERMLSPIFIKSPNYGTRSSTILLIEKSGKITFVEKTHSPFGQEGLVRRFTFQLVGNPP